MNTKNRNKVIDKLDKVLEKITPFNRAFQYNMKMHLLYPIIERLDNLYNDESLTDERIELVIGNYLYNKLMDVE